MKRFLFFVLFIVFSFSLFSLTLSSDSKNVSLKGEKVNATFNKYGMAFSYNLFSDISFSYGSFSSSSLFKTLNNMYSTLDFLPKTSSFTQSRDYGAVFGGKGWKFFGFIDKRNGIGFYEEGGGVEAFMMFLEKGEDKSIQKDYIDRLDHSVIYSGFKIEKKHFTLSLLCSIDEDSVFSFFFSSSLSFFGITLSLSRGRVHAFLAPSPFSSQYKVEVMNDFWESKYTLSLGREVKYVDEFREIECIAQSKIKFAHSSIETRFKHNFSKGREKNSFSIKYISQFFTLGYESDDGLTIGFNFGSSSITYKKNGINILIKIECLTFELSLSSLSLPSFKIEFEV